MGAKPKININEYVIKNYNKKGKILIVKIFLFLAQFVTKKVTVTKNKEKTKKNKRDFILKPFEFQKMKEDTENLDLQIEDIESIVVDEKYLSKLT